MNRNPNGPFVTPNPSQTSLLSSGRPSPSGHPNRPVPPSSPIRTISRQPSTTSAHSHADARSSNGHPPSLSEKYALSASPATWGSPLFMNNQEPDDWLHNPDPRRDRRSDHGGSVFTLRGFGNLGCLSIIVAGFLTLFAGYPLLTHFLEHKQTNQGGFNLGGVNASGQVPDLPGNFQLIDRDTPKEAFSYTSYEDGSDLVLVFSDEFNQDGRTFYPGDDPFWEAVDLHYWGTDDLEWYDPQQVTTKDGKLQLRIDQVEDITLNHNLTYKSAMIQSWNKLCFTGGLLLTSVQLPGYNNVGGLWPAVWTMGNLGRAGFGASVEGLWPYTYDSCDVGTLPNQTYPGTQTPLAATENGDPEVGGELSFLPGQRLSACTCPGESHPGPVRTDGTYVGRAAPELDVVEATIINGQGYASMSLQFAPFDARYHFLDPNDTATFDDPTKTSLNSYRGGRYQQTASGLSLTNPDCYEKSASGCFALYGFEYVPGFDNAYIHWINEVRAWSLKAAALDSDLATEIGRRYIPQEPMYIIANLGMSQGFGTIDFENLTFPSTMQIDYIRIYQRKDSINVGCDPHDYPTAAYISTYQEAYTNYNLTLWSDYGQPWPKNKLMPGGC
ncbi:beta-glucan synthesis-associated protein KRE6 [Gymnopilus junonius]|uniref:Beta-glucan synthesis-associated protein KRE6 n=1 Tax=Gymnopilus junonius TaxID=109634 RepID=A0A9P5NTF2_GYMJU|nr:beta-glucan synthesis-associated protein KRE6 [Gymnopilus junonius]